MVQTRRAIRSFLILADDLTGAADGAAPFRQAGFSALVLANLVKHPAPLPRTAVISLNLHTRDLLAAARVRRVWRRFSPAITAWAQEAFVYQKIDSTLRGHPALEVRLLLNLLGLDGAIIAPAFPKLGRQTLDGVHRVHGVALAETEYVRRHTRSQRSSALPELFAAARQPLPAHLPWPVIERGVSEVTRWLQAHLTEPACLITADAAHEQHLDVLTQAVLLLEQRVLLVGSAGWAERLALAGRALMAAEPPAAGVLGVVGSLSTVATRQVQAAMDAGVTVIPCAPTRGNTSASITTGVRRTAVQGLAAGRHVVIWTHPGAAASASGRGGRPVLRTLAHVVKDIMSTTAISGLAIVGGDTAQEVLRALRASGLILSGEIAAGMPYGRLLGGSFAGLPTATKAGGFGTDTALRDGLDFLQRWAAQ
jgi:uncharacterized protein YgbK (DUF1537 family)